MKKHSTSRKSFNESAGREDDPAWCIIQCPNCKDKDATQNKETWWCRECGWKPEHLKALDELTRLGQEIGQCESPPKPGSQAPPTVTPTQPTQPAPKASEALQPTPAKPTGHPIILTCRTVITKRK